MSQEGMADGALILRFFGGFEVELGGEPLRRLRTPKGLRVLAYLALDPGRSVDKTLLAKAIWPESENPGDNLDRTLRDLRRALGDPARRPLRLVSVGHERLQLQLQRADKTDTLLFEQSLRREDETSLQQAVDLYQGPLLEGWGGREGEAWIEDQRERYRLRYVETLKRLAVMAKTEKRYEAVLGSLRRQLRAGERDETGWCDLMRFFLEKRDFENALQVYERWREETSAHSPAMQALRMQIPPNTQNTLRDMLLPGLPRVFTSLIGREEELREIRQKIEAGSARLVVLTGSGGVGKTRLAIALGQRRSGDFAQGVRFIDLTAALDEASILIQLCAAFKVTGKPELLRSLQSKEILLILDNCEQALRACSALAEQLLMTCPRLHIVATSRHAFRIGEIAWPVPCLALPSAAPEPSLPVEPEALLRYSAIRLFQERAQAMVHTFEITAANAPSVVDICRRLDGIPLAIELAAVPIRMMSPEEINARLTDRFALLNQGLRNAHGRHQTLRATIEWSYELLTEEERRLLRRLSVLVGGWREAAVMEVCTDEGWTSPRIRELLGELVDKSLVVRSGEAESRFRMLESILQYAAEKLAEDKEEEHLYRKRHRDYFLRLVMKLNAEQSDRQEQLLNTLDTEYYNLEHALTFPVRDTEEAQEGLRLGAALQEFWWIRGYLHEGRKRLKALLAHPLAQDRTRARAAALDGTAVLARMQGDLAEARALHEESLGIFRESGQEGPAAYALGNLGIVVWLQHEPALALSLMQESLELHRTLNNEEGIAYCLGNLGNMANETQDYAAARVWMEECLQRMRAQKNDAGIASCLGNLGNSAYFQGDYEAAFSLHAEGLTIHRKLKDKLGIALNLETLADVAFKEGRLERAVCLAGAEERLRRELGAPKAPETQADCDRQLAEALQTLGEERFSSARTEGNTMTLEAAINYALRRAEAL